MSKKHHFRTPFGSQHAKGYQTLLESVRQQFHHIVSSLLEKLSWNMSLLVIFEVLGTFLNTLSADDKHSLCNSEMLYQPLHMQLSTK